MLKRSGSYHLLGSQEDPAKGEGPSMSNGAQIDELRLQVERCIDADLLLPEDGQRLLTALDNALAAPTGASAARGEIAALVDLVQASIAAGALPTSEGQPPLAATEARVAGIVSTGGPDR